MKYYSERKSCFRLLGHKKITGVCAGVAERFDMPTWLTRLLTVLLFLKFPVVTVLAYAIASVVLPTKA
ncbi:PspC domain-containing protein [Pseudoalteromonas sp. MMG022]|uniref:PspC domain-containing protein n=1 Tax=Pseudoalteromonas sp. MMG022 TaxID=2909978 RepID=UPI001F17B33F|nr:PspC domain-containing protein [Pseudoalteromonas sp. MMG022]MCF6434993.1 PspC domain-containing protein [Pseudoalteromonas sp. MMG022]